MRGLSLAKLTFFGGVDEIGGNKILLEDRDKRIFLDFGMSFSFGADFFTGYLQPRRVNGLGDYFEFNLLPRITGLYSKGMLKNAGLRYSKPKFDGVVLSHAHIDHVGHTHFLDETIPLFCGEGTKLILDALGESGGYNSGEHVCRPFRTGKKISLGEIEVEPIHVDHSIPAAYGFIIRTSTGTVVYTGDLRLHGPLSQMTREFVDKSAAAKPDVMISEGTRINPQEKRSNYAEADVKRLSNKVVERSRKLVACSFSGRDIDRFRTFYEVAKENDRQFVITTRMAYLLTKLKTDRNLNIPDVAKDKNILIYVKRKKSGAFEDRDYFVWERPFLDKAVAFDYVQENQPKILLSIDLLSFTELIDIRPEAGDFIHSMSEPFSEEDIESQVMHKWLEHFKMNFHQIHASGHCPSRDLKEIIETIHPKKLFPIHTQEPGYFKKILNDCDVVIPIKGHAFRC
jgi:ribonuclease J